MRSWIPTVIAGATIVATIGCATPSFSPDRTVAVDPVVGMLDKGLTQLDTNLKGLSRRIVDMQQMPETEDPTLRELRALDLSGWQLHQRQWLLQRDHLRFAKEQLSRVLEHPDEKSALLEKWTSHEGHYERLMDDLRQQRQTLERTRFEVEARLIEHYFR